MLENLTELEAKFDRLEAELSQPDVIKDQKLFQQTARQHAELAKVVSSYRQLKKLEEEKLIYKKPYQNNPVRYEYFLTEKGKDLRPLFKEMLHWATKYKKEVIKGEMGT